MKEQLNALIERIFDETKQRIGPSRADQRARIEADANDGDWLKVCASLASVWAHRFHHNEWEWWKEKKKRELITALGKIDEYKPIWERHYCTNWREMPDEPAPARYVAGVIKLRQY